jgi:fibronectin type 3 domain-containing protein
LYEDDGVTVVAGNSIPTIVVYSSSATDLPSEAQTLPAGTTLAGFLDISISNGLVEKFSKTLSVTMNISSVKFNAGDPVVIYSFDSTSKKWVLEDTVFAAADGTVKFSIKHLSVWAAFKDETPPPGKPGDITLSPNITQVKVQWAAPATGATSYNVYYSTSAGLPLVNGINVVGTEYTVTGLNDGTPYYFVVTAVNAYGESGPSAEKSATPGDPVPLKPQNIGAVPGPNPGEVIVSWNPVSLATSYNIYYCKSDETLTTSSTKVSNVTSPQVIPGLTSGQGYKFAVTAVNGPYESVLSSIKPATAP